MNIKFRHGFGDKTNAICAWGSEVETIEHFLLHCHLYSPQRLELFENLKKGIWSFLNLNVKHKVKLLLYGSQSRTSKSSNHEILKFIINYIKETGRFDRPLFCANQWFLDVFIRYAPTDIYLQLQITTNQNSDFTLCCYL